jgi:hypothetical protein
MLPKLLHVIDDPGVEANGRSHLRDSKACPEKAISPVQ